MNTAPGKKLPHGDRMFSVDLLLRPEHLLALGIALGGALRAFLQTLFGVGPPSRAYAVEVHRYGSGYRSPRNTVGVLFFFLDSYRPRWTLLIDVFLRSLFQRDMV